MQSRRSTNWAKPPFLPIDDLSKFIIIILKDMQNKNYSHKFKITTKKSINATPWYNFDSHRELLIHSSLITPYSMCYYNITLLHERAHGEYWPKFHLDSFPLFALITCTRTSTCISLHFLIKGRKTLVGRLLHHCGLLGLSNFQLGTMMTDIL